MLQSDITSNRPEISLTFSEMLHSVITSDKIWNHFNFQWNVAFSYHFWQTWNHSSTFNEMSHSAITSDRPEITVFFSAPADSEHQLMNQGRKLKWLEKPPNSEFQNLPCAETNSNITFPSHLISSPSLKPSDPSTTDLQDAWLLGRGGVASLGWCHHPAPGKDDGVVATDAHTLQSVVHVLQRGFLAAVLADQLENKEKNVDGDILQNI